MKILSILHDYLMQYVLTWWWCNICLWSGQHRVVEPGEWVLRKWRDREEMRGNQEGARTEERRRVKESSEYLSLVILFLGLSFLVGIVVRVTHISAFACPFPPRPTDLWCCPAHKKRLPRPFLLDNLQLCTNTFHLGMQKTIEACAVKETQRQICEGSDPGRRL